MGKKQNSKGKRRPVEIKQNINQTNELMSLIEKLILLTTNIDLNPSSIKDLWDTHVQIDDLLNRIVNIEKTKHTTSGISPGHRDKNSLDNFLLFMKENNAIFEELTLDCFPEYGVGVKTLQQLSQGHLIMSIPRKLMLTVETANKSIIGSLITNDKLLENMPNVALALLLLSEKYQPNSFWKSYINVLPEKYTTVLYFSVDELSELKGSPNFENSLKQCRNIARQYAYFKKLFSNSDLQASQLLRNNFTYEEYRWAVSTIMTRQNLIPSPDGSTMITALIPLWDMINHENGIVSTDFNTELDQSECLAFRDFNAGDQVFMFYGKRTNSDMFLHNGFVYLENEHDSYPLRLGISKSDKLSNLRIIILKRLNLSNQMVFNLQPKSRSLDVNLLNFVKVFNLLEDELKDLEKLSDEKEISEKLNDSEDVNKRAYKFLLARINLLLNVYPTKLDDDIEILNRTTVSTLSECKKLIIKLRMCEKRILQDTVNLLNELLT